MFRCTRFQSEEGASKELAVSSRLNFLPPGLKSFQKFLWAPEVTHLRVGGGVSWAPFRRYSSVTTAEPATDVGVCFCFLARESLSRPPLLPFRGLKGTNARLRGWCRNNPEPPLHPALHPHPPLLFPICLLVASSGFSLPSHIQKTVQRPAFAFDIYSSPVAFLIIPVLVF